MNNKIKIEKKFLYLSSGKGPAECEWVVANLLKLIIIFLERSGLSFKLVNNVIGYHHGTYKSVQILVEGIQLDMIMKPWIGTIRWVGKSLYRPNHKRSNWFIRIDLIDVIEPMSLNETDLEYSTYKASGPGGQHRNKVESAIKVIHRPTGVEAISSDSRSQHQNKKLARSRLIEKFNSITDDSFLALSNTKNQMNNLLVRGNPVKVFKGHKFKEQ